jgi:integrase
MDADKVETACTEIDEMGKAKKGTLRNLPANWRENVWEVASSPEWRGSRPQLCPALAVLWLTGCRPAELKSGVLIGMRNDVLAIEVHGAKLVDAGGRKRGQPTRQYVFKLNAPDAIDHPALLFLRGLAGASELDEKGNHSKVIKHDDDYLYNCVVALGKATFPAMRTRISPYVFRHQLGSDLKADPDVSLEDAAKAMGHLSDYSIGKYGHVAHGRKGGRGSVKPAAVRTTRPVKHSPKVDRLARFKVASAAKRKQQPKAH